jgi:hypothetical protein
MTWQVTCRQVNAANNLKVQYALRLNILQPTKTNKRKNLQISISASTLLAAGWKIRDRVVLLHDENEEVFALQRNAQSGYLIQSNSLTSEGPENGRIVFPIRHSIQFRVVSEDSPRLLTMKQLRFNKTEDLIVFPFTSYNYIEGKYTN